MRDLLSNEECDYLYQAWHNFETIVKTLPSSDTKELLLLGCHYLFEQLKFSQVHSFYVLTLMDGINSVIASSPLVLGLEDIVAQLNQRVALVCYSTGNQPS